MKKDKKPAPRGDVINHSPSENYVWPTDPEVLKKLEWFQDQKLGFMVHWGPYSQLGIMESWSLSDGDAHWSRKEVDWADNGEQLRERYFALNKTFNPLRFHPEDWADFAHRAGYKYLVFTTKHHDGFCMYDTKYSDYRITAPDCPFHTHPKADIARHLFDAFRAKGLGIIPYFSKPDWHCPWYWAPNQERPIAYDRNPTYDPREKPELWNQFVRFTHAQMMELVTTMGPVEGLWLDGGQVRPHNGQDLRMAEFAEKARKAVPGLLIADRTVGGPYENYITPEQTAPEHALDAVGKLRGGRRRVCVYVWRCLQIPARAGAFADARHQPWRQPGAQPGRPARWTPARAGYGGFAGHGGMVTAQWRGRTPRAPVRRMS